MADVKGPLGGPPPRDALGQKLEERLREVRPNEYSEEKISLPAVLQELWTSGTLLAANGSEASPWVDLSYVDSLRIGRTHAGGAYALEVDWSRDGATPDITQAIVLANNDTGELAVAARFARFRVRNTDGVSAFTAHRTNVFGR